MWPKSARQHPERRRALIIGAGCTGMSAAFHLGEHSLLLERRDSLENSLDHSADFPLGAAYGSALGDEDPGADGYGQPVSSAEKKALFISCSSQTLTSTGEHALIHVARWQPPDLAPTRAVALRAPPAVRTLRPLLRGELRLNARVVRVAPAEHLVALADGHRIVYDKLVSTLSLPATQLLVEHDLPHYVRRDESMRFWLSEHDVEVADRTIQEYYGDLDEFAAGKRIASQLSQVLADKFHNKGRCRLPGTRLFEPRLVMPGP